MNDWLMWMLMPMVMPVMMMSVMMSLRLILMCGHRMNRLALLHRIAYRLPHMLRCLWLLYLRCQQVQAAMDGRRRSLIARGHQFRRRLRSLSRLLLASLSFLILPWGRWSRQRLLIIKVLMRVREELERSQVVWISLKNLALLVSLIEPFTDDICSCRALSWHKDTQDNQICFYM